MVKNYDNKLSRFHRILERNRQTDGQTDLLYQISISLVGMLTCEKKRTELRQYENISHADNYTVQVAIKGTPLLNAEYL